MKVSFFYRVFRLPIRLTFMRASFPFSQIKAVFQGLGKVTDVRPDIGDTWFVTMEDETTATDALLKLRLSGTVFVSQFSHVGVVLEPRVFPPLSPTWSICMRASIYHDDVIKHRFDDRFRHNMLGTTHLG